MAGSVNKVILVGNLGRDPEVRVSKSGSKIANLSVATSETWRHKETNERQERTEWHRVAIFNEKLAEIAERYLKKGSKIYVEGQLQTRKWQDQSGNDRYTTEVVLSSFRGNLTMLDGVGSGSAPSESLADPGAESGSPADASPPGSSPHGSSPEGPAAAAEDDDIPF